MSGHQAPLSAALDGRLVVEIGDRMAAGGCGTLLAQLGADVVLVEPPEPRRDHKWSGRAAVAAGKHSLVTDLRSNRDATMIRNLLHAADVVLISSDLSERDRTLWQAERPPAQVLCDISAFGHTGPLAGMPASEALVEAYAGVAETTGPRGAPPATLGVPVIEMETAVYAAAAVVAALRVRRRSGRGQRIDMALYDVAVNALLAFLNLPFSGRIATRDGNRHLALAPWNAYRAVDGWVQICAPTTDQWRRLCDATGRSELADDPRFATPSNRHDHVEVIDRVVGGWVAGQTVDGCVAVLGRHVIPCGPVTPVADLPGEPNVVHRQMLRRVPDPVSGQEVLVPGSPLAGRRASAVPAPDAGRAAAEDLIARTGARGEPADRADGGPGEPGSVTAGGAMGSHRPLDGVRVIEIGMNTVAPLACKQLGALGADVIKIEPPRGDSNRWNGPLRADGESYVFALSNTDKRGLVLDLRAEEDQAALWELLRTADVLVENLKPGSLARLGFGADDVRRRLPGLVYCSVNGFGHDSAYPGRPALDTVVQAMSGIMAATTAGGSPTKAGISAADQIGGLLGLLGVLAALELRDHSGTGCALDLAMHDGSVWLTHPVWNGSPHRAQVASVADRYVVTDEAGRSAPVLTVDEVLAHPQTAARDLLVEVPTSDGDRWTVLGTPLKLLSTPALVRTAMPRLGVVDADLAAELGPGARLDRSGREKANSGA